MTSSLVGSEMCIRDRLLLGLLLVVVLLMPVLLLLVACAYAVVVVGIGAVSYTHLTLPTICSV
eukprot:7564041-Prorocentrum_lima.AAC.1